MKNPERIEADDLPNGGVYALVYYHDADGALVEKGQASRMEVFEYDKDNKPISHTVLQL